MKRARTIQPERPAFRLLVPALYLVAAIIFALAILSWQPPIVRVLHVHKIELGAQPAPEKQTYPPKNRL